MKHTNYIILRSFYTVITNKNEQVINEGVNISTRFVRKAGERLQEDEHILADDSSGHATLTMVRMERSDSDNVDTVDNCLPLCSSCHALVCGLTVEHRSLASGSEINENSDLATAAPGCLGKEDLPKDTAAPGVPSTPSVRPLLQLEGPLVRNAGQNARRRARRQGSRACQYLYVMHLLLTVLGSRFYGFGHRGLRP